MKSAAKRPGLAWPFLFQFPSLAGLLSGRFAASPWFPSAYHEEKATSPVESLPYIAPQIAPG
jgi:hypothetical protein